jgi:small-conductance mechanosensitive channel
MPKIVATVAPVPRVLSDPKPGVGLSNFAADGLELTIAFWIRDPENGLGGVRSDVNLALLRLFAAENVEIPYPQRVVRTLPIIDTRAAEGIVPGQSLSAASTASAGDVRAVNATAPALSSEPAGTGAGAAAAVPVPGRAGSPES